jgi:hypothetical protein
MRVPVRPAVAPAPPRRRALLRDPDHHHPEAALPLGRLEVLARDLLLDVALHAAHPWDLVLGDEPIDRLDILAADPPQHRRRGNRKAPVEQKPDHLKLRLQPRNVALKEQPIDRPDLERDVVGE